MAIAHLWVGNADNWESEEILMEQVKDITGITVKTCWFVRDRQTGQKQGFGFMEFQNMTEASEVLRLLRGTPIPGNPNGKRFSINWGQTKPEGDSEIMQRADGFTCYVGNLPNYIDDQKLLEYFQRYFPSVINARVVHQGGISKGYGFVKFNTHAEVLEAVRTLNNSTDFGRSLRVNEGAANRTNNSRDTSDINISTLFISDLDTTIVNESILNTQFSTYGNIISIKFDPERPSWATIKMENHSAAESAKNALQGARFGGTTKCVINWGRSIEETQANKSTSITVPIMKPQKLSKKVHADFYNTTNVHKIIDYIQNIAEAEREFPLKNAIPIQANRKYSESSIQNSLKMKPFSSTFPSGVSFWYY